MNKIRVLLVDDHALFREGLRSLLEEQADIEVVGEANDGLEVADLVSKLEPTVILMDINMSVIDGIKATSVVIKNNPTVGIIILTMYPQDEYALEALKAGAKAYVVKDTPANKLLHVIRSVHQGQAVIDLEITTRLLGELRRMDKEDKQEATFERLSDQELQVLTLVANGASNRDIAEDLQLTERTIKNYITTILSKLRVTNRTEAVMRAMKEGLIELN
jgi:NarL family two-component system response regulator LiaR